MKHLFTLFLSLSLSLSVFAQAPQSLSYQAIARNNTGKIIPNKSLGLRVSVHNLNATGATVYQETFSAKTNTLGLFTLNIGEGSPVFFKAAHFQVFHHATDNNSKAIVLRPQRLFGVHCDPM